MNFSYQIYQAERPMSGREQRETDIRAGERAASLARLWRSFMPPRHQSAAIEPGAHEAIGQSCVTTAR
jgi:hypothetical protein